MSHNKHDKAIKNIGVICLSVIIFALVYNVLLGGNGFNAHMGYGQTSGFGLGGSLSVILALVIKLLFLMVIVAVVAGIVAAIKNQGLENIDLSFIDKLFDDGQHRRHLCPHCHREVEHDWKNCPYCGLSTKKEHKTHKHETKENEITDNLAANIDAVENANIQVESQQASAVESRANDVSSTKIENSKKTKTEPKKNAKTKK